MPIQWLRYSKDEADKQLNMLANGNAHIELPEEYTKLKKKLEDASESVFNEIKDMIDTRKDYPFELRFAIRLYTILVEHGFSLWEAADDGIWAFLSISVIPDIVLKRCNGEYNEDRFYKRSKRIWLKMLWWYIFLSMEEDNGKINIERTFEKLKDNTSDNINQLLDRSGTGFRIELYRSLMGRYKQVTEGKNLLGEKREDYFRLLIRQTRLRSLNIDPDLCDINHFIDDIFTISK